LLLAATLSPKDIGDGVASYNVEFMPGFMPGLPAPREPQLFANWPFA
jgi:hypothetical protein